VENNTFYHPLLRFQCPLPQGWQVNNLPTQVEVVSPQNTAAILLNVEEEKDPQAAAQEFIERTKGKVQLSEKTTVNGLAAYRTLSDILSGETPVRVISLFIAMEDHLYVLHGLSSPDQFGTYRTTFEATLNGFAPLRDQRMLSVRPKRIYIQRVGETAPLRTFLASHTQQGIGEKDLAIINGMNPDDIVTTGSLLKYVGPDR
jgi:predicted Zn-dependent protease